LSNRHYDVVVVGGGINGVGVAQAAAAAGHSVLLLEKEALGSGTSSKSSKLIHGGLRYLESYEFSLVRESLRERELLLRLAPELVKLMPFYIPVFRNTRRRPWLVRTGLSLYALLGGLDPIARFESIDRAEWAQLDGLILDGLDAVYRYQDGQTDDELLTRAIMRSAETLGAELAAPAHFQGATLDAQGCEVNYLQADKEVSCRANVLVNAAGPWVNLVLDRIRPTQQARPIELVQGTHILLPEPVEKGIYYVEAPRDGRAVFLMPRGGHTLVGTTETRYQGDPDKVHPLRAEENYLCKVVNHYFPRYEAARDRLLESWAGLRVLPAGKGHAFHRSRETILDVDGLRGNPKPRLLSIYGGKLTSYRATAEKVIERIRASLPQRERVANTDELPLTPG
jgi:glycerol-3-phosphate dehydrogenase